MESLKKILSILQDQNTDIQTVVNGLGMAAAMIKATLLLTIVNLLLLLKLFIGHYQLAKNQIDIAREVQKRKE